MDFLQILRPATVYPCHSVICYLMSEHKYGRKTTLLIWAADALIWSALIVMGGLHPESYIVYRYVYVFSVHVNVLCMCVVCMQFLCTF